jgi:hypothetical protein
VSALRASPATEAQRAVVDALARDGIALVPYEALFREPSWAELQADVAPFVRAGHERMRTVGRAPASKREYIVRRFSGGEGVPRFTGENPWLRIGVSETMIGIVQAYRGEEVRLHYLDNWFTVPYARAGERVASQRWHRDLEDQHVVKCFLYFSDVDDECGPFEYVQGSAAGGPYGQLWAWGTSWRDERGAEERWYPPQDELERQVAAEDRLRLTGPKGTLILCDTSGFHRGGYARSKPRLLSIHTYSSPAATYDRMNFAVVWASGGGGLSRQARYALT